MTSGLASDSFTPWKRCCTSRRRSRSRGSAPPGLFMGEWGLGPIYELTLSYFFLKRSTRPAVSTRRCLPV